MLPDIDANPVERHVLATGLDLHGDPEPYDPYVACEVCGHRWKPLPQNREKAQVCSNRCAMKNKKRTPKEGEDRSSSDRHKARPGPARPKHPMPHRPWEHVKKRNTK